MTNTKKLLAAVALVAATSSAALAQTDFGSPMGAGAGLGSSVAPLGMPGSRQTASGGGNFEGSRGALSTARANFVNATGGGVTVSNPAGGTVTVPQALAQALGAVLGGNATAQQSSALAAAFGGGSTGGQLVSALGSLSSFPNGANVLSAVRAFNAAVNALPAGQAPSPALLAARQVIAGAIAARSN